MTSVLEITTHALRKIGVVAADEAATADQNENAIYALNSMIHAFELEGVDLEWTDKAAADEFPLDAKFHEGILYLLADRLSPDYSIPKSFDADNWFRSFQAALVEPPTSAVPSALTRLTSSRRRGTTYRGG